MDAVGTDVLPKTRTRSTIRPRRAGPRHCYAPAAARDVGLSDVGLFLPPAQVTLHDARGELPAAGVEGDALGQLSKMVDEADPLHAPVILDQSKRADAAPLAHGHD